MTTPRYFLRTGAVAGATTIHHVDVIGATLTVFAIIYSALLVSLIADAIIGDTINKLVRVISF
jgi:hypothetical protein